MLHVFETAEPVEWCLKKFHGLQSTIYLRTPRESCGVNLSRDFTTQYVHPGYKRYKIYIIKLA